MHVIMFETKSKNSPVPILLIIFALWMSIFSANSPAQVKGEIAFLRMTEGFWQVWLMKAEGKGTRQLTSTPIDKVHMAWGPGNQTLLYHTNRGETYVYNLATKATRRILEDLRIIDAAWSPDGKKLAYGLQPEDLVNGKTALWVSDINGDNSTRIAGGGAGDALAAMWYKGGEELVFRQCVMANNMEVHHDFWVSNPQGKNLKPVLGDSEMYKFDQVVSSSGQIAYASARTGYYEIWTIPVAGGQPRQLTKFRTHAANPSWSPDEQYIALDVTKNSQRQIYRINKDGSGLTQLTRGKVLSRKPVWSRAVQ